MMWFGGATLMSLCVVVSAGHELTQTGAKVVGPQLQDDAPYLRPGTEIQDDNVEYQRPRLAVIV